MFIVGVVIGLGLWLGLFVAGPLVESINPDDLHRMGVFKRS